MGLTPRPTFGSIRVRRLALMKVFLVRDEAGETAFVDRGALHVWLYGGCADLPPQAQRIELRRHQCTARALAKHDVTGANGMII
jgi:hypothetical protein